MRSIGKEIEEFVSAYLQQQGLKLVATNYHCKFGEIDLIMLDHDETLVFVEVRYRSNDDYGDGVATISKSKQSKIIKTASRYLQEQSLYDKVLCRFDVVAVAALSPLKINWIKDAFWQKW